MHLFRKEFCNMETTITRTQSVKVRNHCDILVVGAGPAGIGAAVTAARAGARVTLIENGGKPGGMWTLGLLSPFFDNKNHDGLNRELREALQARNAWGGLWDISFDPVQMTLVLNEMIREAKIDLLLYTTGCEPILEDNCVKGVFIQNKSGTGAILADVTIDCTGDGDIAARAGAPFRIGRDRDGVFQPMTMMFKIGGVRDEYPTDRILDWYTLLEQRVPDKEKFLRDVPFNFPALIKLPRSGEALVQWTHVRYRNGSDGEELSCAAQEGFRQVENAMEYFKLIRDFLGDVYLMELPAVIGVRETRRITGEYIVTDDDVRNGTVFPDNICTVKFGVDIHEPDQAGQTNIGHNGFHIPFRSLVPLGVENLLTAGRCISGSYMAHAAYRVTGDCLKMGEGAGYGACEAIKRKLSVREFARRNSSETTR